MRRKIVDQNELRELLIDNMFENEITFKEISYRIGVSVNTLGAFLDNKQKTSLITIAKMIKYLDRDKRNKQVLYSDIDNIA